ncbi:MAG: glucose-6-phosphate isomerase [Gaiellaceae bacterium]
MSFDASTAVEQIWARDASLWTGRDEASWLGWLDVAERMRAQVGGLADFAASVGDDGLDNVVLLGMGGSSLAPEVMRRLAGATSFHVLDSTHPAALLAAPTAPGVERTLFLIASKSGTTIETRSQLEFFWEKTGANGGQFAAITDPGSELETLASERGFRATFSGEAEVGGRYSALSAFGMVPAALMGLDLEAVLDGALGMAEACRAPDVNENPGLALGLELGAAWHEGRDKVILNPNPGAFGLWVEQLIAESTGKDGKGLVPCPDESPEGADRQAAEIKLADIADVGAEFFRFEFATAIVGAMIGINPFDQPNVQEAKDRTGAILAGGEQPVLDPVGSVDSLLDSAREGDYVTLLAFVPASIENERELARARAELSARTGLPTTAGFGPRYLHSTGQLHKGGPGSGLFIQLVDDPPHLDIPGRDYGFRRLIRAQAQGDFEALLERGRRAARVSWSELVG